MKNKKTIKDRAIPIIFFVALIVIIGYLTRPVINMNNANPENTLSVSGRAEMEANPNQAEVFIGITNQGQDAKSVQDQNAEFSDSVISALVESGVNEGDIETSSYYLSPKREYDPVERKYVDNGYTLTHNLKITTEDVTKTGQIIDIATDNGATDINSINFKLSKELEAQIRSEVLAQAGTEARAKAENIAQSMDVKLGDVYSISESNFYYSPYTTYAEKAAGNTPTTIQPGKVTLTATISAIFKID